MKNLTITVDEEVARWARVYAAEQGSSVSRVVGEMLRDKMRQEQAYELAMQRFLARAPAKLKRRGKGYPTRDEIHDR